MILVIILLISYFFYQFLPSYTNHKETITVPDLVGLSFDKVDEFVTNNDLRYEVEIDSGYSSEFPALTILKQYPKPGSKVKSNRKIFLNLNKTKPRQVEMPDLVEKSVKSAQMILESKGLRMGEIRYKPDFAQNSVLEQHLDGKEVPAGIKVYQGSKVDLVVGDGLGNRSQTVPGLVGMDYEDAEVAIIGSSLRIGSIISAKTDSAEVGTVVKQIPASGGSIRVGGEIDLWVEGYKEGEQTVDTDDGNGGA